jgi:hypothetical protein
MQLPAVPGISTRFLFVATVGLGSFLVFLIQPLAARCLLPEFGGSGSVWITALVFYQVVLALGSLLAHALRSHLGLRGQVAGLLVVMAGALLWQDVPPRPVGLWPDLPGPQLLLSLLVSVGLPFLALAAAGPLVQNWAGRSGCGSWGGRRAYSLFAVSSSAALLALLGYPLLLEPLCSVVQQGRVWMALFCLQCLLLAVLFFRVWRRLPAGRPASGPGTDAEPRATGQTRQHRILWLAWSAAGVMVLNSSAGMIGQEFASFPLLWILPLLLYLLTWIAAFRGAWQPGYRTRATLLLAAQVLFVASLAGTGLFGMKQRLAFSLLGMTCACLVVHVQLYRFRPRVRHLTGFSAYLAVGGALGGLTSGVIFVRIFTDWRDLALALGLVTLLFLQDLIPKRNSLQAAGVTWRRVVAPGAGLIAFSIWLFAASAHQPPGLRHANRDFHGLVRVVEEDAGIPARHRLVLYHGATVHGLQLLDDRLSGMATTYFGRGTGVDLAWRALAALRESGGGLKAGTVGLGTGTLASYLGPGDSMCFYEVSPAVARVAAGEADGPPSDPRFTFLQDSAGQVQVVVGDARLSLARELERNAEGHAYDLLVLDAFAGDGVPIHLLTREAFDLYRRHVGPGGMLAVNVSSNWIDLVPVLYSWADAENWEALTVSTRAAPDGLTVSNAVWVLLFQDREIMSGLAHQCRPLMVQQRIMVQNRRNVEFGNLKPWTDDRADLVRLLRTRIRPRDQTAQAISRKATQTAPAGGNVSSGPGGTIRAGSRMSTGDLVD